MWISACVQHHPSRVGLLPRLTGGLGACEIIADPMPEGEPSPWRSFQRCLALTPDGASHRLVVQDDATVCDGFRGAVTLAVEARPDRVLVLYHGSHPAHSAHRLVLAACQGETWIRVEAEDWLPLVATVWPADLARSLAASTEDYGRADADDERSMRWLAAQGEYALACVPSLVQHPDDSESIVGGRKRPHPRRALCYVGDQVGLVDWDSGAA